MTAITDDGATGAAHAPFLSTDDLHALFAEHTPEPEVLAENAATGTRVSAGSIGALDVLLLEAPGGTVFLSRYGAHVLTWRPTDREDALFLSAEAALDGSDPIRGGIPVCWPWFNLRADPKHGWARRNIWELDATEANEANAAVRCRLEVNGAAATLSVSVDDGLFLELRHDADPAPGTGAADEVTAALHTYFLVGDYRHTTVYGIPNGDLDPLFDQAIGPRVFPADGIDTVGYLGIPFERDLQVVDGAAGGAGGSAGGGSAGAPAPGTPGAGTGRSWHMVTDASDVVMWNPAAGLADTTATAFERFVCVEPARITEPMAPGDVLGLRLEVG